LESYILAHITLDRDRLAKILERLDAAGISAMIEHASVVKEGLRAAGYKVLVPVQCLQAAMRWIEPPSMSECLKGPLL
jgi:hypothetical protein